MRKYLDNGSITCGSWSACLKHLNKGDPGTVLTSSFEDLTRSLRAIGEGEGDDLVVSGVFDLSLLDRGWHSRRWMAGRDVLTFSTMTSGPLTPPTVL